MSNKLMYGALAVAISAAVGFAACDDKQPEPGPAKSGPAKASPKASANSPAKMPAATPKKPAASSSGMRWTKPDAWTKVDHPSRMRKATFGIPKAEGDSQDGEMSVTQVGGTVAANIKRWEGQFSEAGAATTEEKTVNGLTVTIVEKSGTFNGMAMPGRPGAEPAKDFTLLAAVVHTQPAHYFKLTGPTKTVKAARADFDKLVASFALAK